MTTKWIDGVRTAALLASACSLFFAEPAAAQGADPPPPDAPPPEAAPAPAPTPEAPAPQPAPEPPSEPARSADRETDCKNRIDDDGDSVTDCADADCYDRPECKPGGQAESTNLLCSDWIDNDGDGALDCDDTDCQAKDIAACRGSWRGGGAAAGSFDGSADEIPELGEGQSVEDLVGTGRDKDGERNDLLCSDGIDNDNDGRTDCADFGCRFDPSVSVCTGNPGMRFSVVTSITQAYRIEDTNAEDIDRNRWDTRFSLLQLRAFGPIPGVQDSFFLLSMRAERTPRLTFAMFQVPIGTGGHFFNINSGGGGLSSGLIISASKQLLLEPPFYLYSAFEQGNGAAAEVGGPVDSGGRVWFRAFGAGGSGRFSGNVGGRFFADDNTNYTWGSGAQIQLNAVGYYSRYDTPFIYTPVPATLAFSVGGKYDQRAQERYPAVNVQGVLRYDRFVLMGEVYAKRELEFESTQYAYNVSAGVLVWPKTFLLAADFGEYIAGDLDNPPDDLRADLGDEIRRQRDERQWRLGLHWYAYKNTGLLSALYKNREVKSGRITDDGFKEQEAQLVASYRF